MFRLFTGRLMSCFGSWKALLDTLVTAIFVVAAGVVIWTHFGEPARATGRQLAVPKIPVELGVNLEGSPVAPIVLMAFSDFECPF